MLGVFTWLGQYIYNALKYLFAGIEKIFGPVLARMLPVLCPVAYGVYWIVAHAAAWITEAESYLASIHLPGTSLTGLSLLSVANTFFPVTEGMAMLAVYLTALMTLNIYRLVKSWIPTIS